MNDRHPQPDLLSIARTVVESHPDEVAIYRRGGPMLGFLLGKCMKALATQGSPTVSVKDVQDALRQALVE